MQRATLKNSSAILTVLLLEGSEITQAWFFRPLRFGNPLTRSIPYASRWLEQKPLRVKGFNFGWGVMEDTILEARTM